MSLPMLIQLPLGVFLALGVALAAYRLRALTPGGAAAAGALGAVIFGLGGLPWAIVLLGFFISSSALSRLFGRRKARFDEKFSKGSRRDAAQVLANGGFAGLMAAVFPLAAISPQLETLLWLAFCASLAAATADTWATELGVLSRRFPVLITNGRTVEPGTSGGISLAGTLAALGGAGLIALLGAVLDLGGTLPFTQVFPPGTRLGLYGLALLAGMAGSLVDSTLGASVQGIYTCPACHKETERHPLHTCGTPTTQVRGWGWLNNDWVNTACTLSAALLVFGIGLPLLTGLTREPPMMAHPLRPTIDSSVEKTQVAYQSTTPPLGSYHAPIQAPNPTTASYPPALESSTALPSATSPSQGRLALNLHSQAFGLGQPIPPEYTCLGANRSPDLAWSGVPPGAASLALVVDDPDSPGGTFTHWLLYNLPPSVVSLPAGQPQAAVLAGLGTQGFNDMGHAGYDGACPPPGSPHHYYFRLYATDLPIGALPGGLSAASLRQALVGHILAQGEWMGTFHS